MDWRPTSELIVTKMMKVKVRIKEDVGMRLTQNYIISTVASSIIVGNF